MPLPHATEDRPLASPPIKDSPAGEAVAALRQVLDSTPHAIVTFDALGRVIESNCAAAERASHLQQLSQAILQSSPYSVMVIGLEGSIIDVNPATEALLGYRRDELIGQSPRLFHDPQEVLQRAARLSADMGRAVRPGPELFFQQREFYGHEGTEWMYVRKDGSRVPVGLSVRLSIDISVRRSIADRIRHMAEHDVLIGCYNRAALLGGLRALGAHIAIDDFGAGYSSLSYLQDLPVDRIKIARVFLHGIQPPPASEQGRLVAALVAMGRSLDLHITAKGVETPAQADCYLTRARLRCAAGLRPA